MIGSMYFSAGIGDFLKVVSHFIPKKILYASNDCGRSNNIGTLCRQLGIEFQQILHDKVYYRKWEAEAAYGKIDCDIDGSIEELFPRLGRDFEYIFKGNPLLELNLERQIKDDYCLCVPASENFGVNRDLTQQEMGHIVDSNKKVVVMHKGRLRHSLPPHCINMVNKTSILEAIGLVKYASSYCGVDSWAACLFSELGRPMTVKSTSTGWYRWFDIYTANKFGNTDHIKSVPRIK